MALLTVPFSGQGSFAWSLILPCQACSEICILVILGVLLEMSDPCQFGNGGCTHICLRTEQGTAECACNPGYDLQADGRTCRDRDECLTGEAACHGPAVICTNEIGTYRCECQPGFRLAADGHSCQVHSFQICQGRWGVGCQEYCDCIEDIPCDPQTGQCQCPIGRHGDRCDLSGCQPGYWGQGCDRPCPDNCGTSRCERETGQCACAPGTYGSRCHLSCPEGTWGHLCRLRCPAECKGPGKKSRGCHPETGKCVCEPGYRAPECIFPCQRGTFGTDCRQTCYDCTDGCDPVTGRCNVLCPAGKRGPKCDEGCELGTYGPGCTKKCDCGPGEVGCDPVGTESRVIIPVPKENSGKAAQNRIATVLRACAESSATRTSMLQNLVQKDFGVSRALAHVPVFEVPPVIPLLENVIVGPDGTVKHANCPVLWTLGQKLSTECECSGNSRNPVGGKCDRFTGKCQCPEGLSGPRCQERELLRNLRIVI
ncbi:Multiple epidermal growth factor domains protein 6 [Fasciola gigantica]|uniref:Multiple epidermal growth factor domains protein 6 n=1 Tax=Fasciola gigantica TaxID=46835 RepID=A0A504YBI6_FASGI|nr:Multiple epidermal growth factor domains protein 6 [Fasciola gigantica]